MSYSRNGAGTIGGTTAYVGQLVVDLYDGATAAFVWREVVSKTINQQAKPDKRQKSLEKSSQNI